MKMPMLMGTVFRLSIPMGPVIQTLSRTGGVLILGWGAILGQSYQVQYRTNLNQTNWANWGDVITATNAAMALSDNTGSEPRRFYRVVLLP